MVLTFIWLRTKKTNNEKIIKISCLINELLMDNGSFEMLYRVISPKVINDDMIKYNLPKYSLDP